VLSYEPNPVVEIWPDRSRVILALGGALDIATVPAARRAATELLESGWEHLVVDLSEVEFMDSQGVHFLLESDSAARERGRRFEIVDGSPAVSRILQMVGVDGHFRRADRSR